jgi:hypothetical protein
MVVDTYTPPIVTPINVEAMLVYNQLKVILQDGTVLF